ncbi:NfeD family protein [Sphingomonas japonica]|uniref:NfeD-like C-terminal domain-containing protein n=1 Tax=Sphingomonas japonica TaxID=511662 RepID=A0ABX0U6Y2_9SPHN|nr:NfeD family protein [Sphingomonas japonica]NIJ25087.1 hypothetical protein [Sphingomonas japonica]
MNDWFASPGLWWLAAAAAFALVELLVPGVFLVFLALAAGITGVFTLLFPDLPVAGQLASFAAWAVASVLIGKRWYVDYPVVSADPLLNDRAARLVGEQVVVTQAIENGRGRVRLHDGEWPASGADAPVGTRLSVVAVTDGVVVVEPRP